MLEAELARLSDRGEELKRASELVSRYEKGLNDINMLLNPKVQVGGEGRVEVLIEAI